LSRKKMPKGEDFARQNGLEDSRNQSVVTFTTTKYLHSSVVTIKTKYK